MIMIMIIIIIIIIIIINSIINIIIIILFIVFIIIINVVVCGGIVVTVNWKRADHEVTKAVLIFMTRVFLHRTEQNRTKLHLLSWPLFGATRET